MSTPYSYDRSASGPDQDDSLEKLAKAVGDLMRRNWHMSVKHSTYYARQYLEGKVPLVTLPPREGTITVSFRIVDAGDFRVEVSGLLRGERPHHGAVLAFESDAPATEVGSKVAEQIEKYVDQLTSQAAKLPPNRV